jgi:large subunit ribosomal protein L13
LASQQEKVVEKSASKQEKVVEKSSIQIVVDGTDHIAGRLCSNVAKLLLQGNRVSIVNCDKIMISGKRQSIIEEYKAFLEIASILHPKHGPFHPRRPDTMISRMVRGMLPRKKPSGQAALKRLRAYIDVPKELKSAKKIQFENAKIKKSNSYFTSMASLGETIGWTK